MKLTDEVKIIFINKDGIKKDIEITIDKLLDSTKDDLYELLENTIPCTCSEFCECDPNFEGYEVSEMIQL